MSLNITDFMNGNPANVIILSKRKCMIVIQRLFRHVMPDIIKIIQRQKVPVLQIHASRAVQVLIQRQLIPYLIQAVRTHHITMSHHAHYAQQAHTTTRAPAHRAPHAQTRPITRIMWERGRHLLNVHGCAPTAMK